MSNEACRNAPPAASSIARSITARIPSRSMSAIVNTWTPTRRSWLRSPRSTLRMPTSTVRASSAIGTGQGMSSNRWSPVRPSATDSGMPWTLPLGEVDGELMSVCASSHTTPPGPPNARARPPSVPIAIEWSPPSTSGISPSATDSATRSASSSQVRRIADQ